MLTVLVSLRVKPEHVKAFTEVTIEDVRSSLQDTGVLRFDMLQESDAPTHFVLHEVYQTRDDGLRHLELGHFKQWQAAIHSMLLEPPQATTYLQVYPESSE